ncbi:RHS repeat-associated core domain-containing protein, partial [Glaciecola sp. SC05]|uniref:RHS repeat-associated core domain-containing protein n=1 Tax=Glaciecola sp. SC05 TaxID=1987355 RepID=UPI00352728E0
YNIGRFMSVDPFIHGGSQGINPYSYIMNNPLAGTDPTGYAPDCDASGVQCYEPPKDKNSICKLDSSECNATGWSSRPSKESTGNNGANASPQNNTPPESAADIESEESKDDNFGTNVENSDISGSRVGGKKPEEVDVNFKIDKIKGHDDGWEDPHEAALAFYKQNEDAYQNTDKNTELIGFLIKADNGNYYFTNAVEVPATFNMNVGIRKPTSWKIKDTLHTHPGGRGNQEGFSKTDAQAVLSGSTPGYYVRTPKGDVRFINKSIAKRTRQRWGAKGESICSGGSSCMTPYGSSN